MKIGCLGEIAFEVSDSTIKTLRDVSWSGSASISTHQRHLGKGLAEFVGADPDSIDFKIRVSKYLGADPLADIAKIGQYEKNGTAVPLTIGTKTYGEYRWLIKKHKITLEYFDAKGDLTSADISLTLTEYAKE